MPKITLPDGSVREVASGSTIADLALSIGPGLAKAALAAKVDGVLVDLSYPLTADHALTLLTEKDPDALEVIRHSTAHLLAQAVKQLYPTAQITIGPVIEDGFYYDIAFGRTFTPDDLEKIEVRMTELTAQDLAVTRDVLTREQAIALFKSLGESYKVRLIEDLPETESLSVYRQGDFVDLCRGPHVPSTGRLKAFKLTKLAGAYWRGDSNNEMLQRIYGTAWQNKAALTDYLHRLEEAEKRDHRKLAKAMDLFHIQEEAPGMIFWHAKGWTLYRLVENYIRDTIAMKGYDEVRTPTVVDRSLWEKSGHWDKFRGEMFTTSTDNRDYAIKPMNCPCHVQIFNQGLRSYRDLPLRLAEFGSCHRSEPSGTLHGLMRLRNFIQDDAHIFCTPEQIQSEVSDFIDLLYAVYRDFGFEDVILKLSTRPEQRVGSDAVWDIAEQALATALDEKGLAWTLFPGEGAFYGPKIEFSLKDCIGRVWQCGTIQVDFSMPERLEASYVALDGSKQTPVMLHRAILGSIERFVGILIEHHAGHFPLWLSPVQIAVANITDKQEKYVEEITNSLLKRGFRAISDLRNEKIGFKIRQHTLQRIPYMLVIGDRELSEHTVAVRTQAGVDLGSMTLDAFVDHLTTEIQQKCNHQQG